MVEQEASDKAGRISERMNETDKVSRKRLFILYVKFTRPEELHAWGL